jgi:hypothetical protein
MECLEEGTRDALFGKFPIIEILDFDRLCAFFTINFSRLDDSLTAFAFKDADFWYNRVHTVLHTDLPDLSYTLLFLYQSPGEILMHACIIFVLQILQDDIGHIGVKLLTSYQ